MAQQLAEQGRYGDSMLVHMNPAEVAGINALTPGGLTRNPQTGQPEAFAFLVPLISSGIVGAAGLSSAAASAALGATLSGIGTYALTKDASRAGIAALTGGIGGAVAGAAGAAGEAASAVPEVVSAGVDAIPAEGLTGAFEQVAADATAQAAADATTQAATEAAQTGFDAGRGFTAMKDVLGDKGAQLALIGGGGLSEQIGAQKAADEEMKRLSEERDAEGRTARERSTGILQSGYAAAQPFAPTGQSPFGNPNYPSVFSQYAADGGIMEVKKMQEGGSATPSGEVAPNYFGPATGNWQNFASAYGGRNRYAGFNPMFDFGGGGAGSVLSLNQSGMIDPVSIQAGLRGNWYVPTPEGYRPGYQGEHLFFTNVDPNAPAEEPVESPVEPIEGGDVDPVEVGGTGSGGGNSGRSKNKKALAEGGTVPLVMGEAVAEVPAGGIAEVPNEFREAMPSQTEVMTLAQAILGQTEEAEAIVESFVRRYGPEMYRQIRQMVLQSVVPGAQTEGMIRGQGSGMDDQVPGMIGDQQRVAVSPGEYIVPADVVSGIGDGSSDAGAEELDRMSDDVRMARTGGRMQAPPINARKYMPA
jgi:hypothetical protein